MKHWAKHILFYLVLLVFILSIKPSTAQQPSPKIDRFFGMLEKGITVYNIATNPEILNAVKTFTDSTGVMIYIVPHIADTTKLARYFNTIADLKDPEKKNPHIIIQLNFTPKNIDYTSFELSIDLQPSTDIQIAEPAFNAVEADINNLFKGKQPENTAEILASFKAAIQKLLELFGFGPDHLDATANKYVSFAALPTQQYGFDAKEQEAWESNYEKIPLSDNTFYYVPYKSIGENKTDEVIANINIPNFKIDSLSFKTREGTVIQHTTIGNKQYKISINSNTKVIYAYHGIEKLGKLRIKDYYKVEKKLYIVTVNGTEYNTNEIAQNLNKIYQQANVSWTVTTGKPNFTFELGEDGLEAADATLFSKYSPEMRALRNAYQEYDSEFNTEAYYLFVVPTFTDATQVGYMVRGRAVGFITPTATTRDIAHELGHGTFGLEHTFPNPPQGSTNNLMDYSSGTALTYKQWKDIHSIFPTIYWFDNEEDAATNLEETSKYKITIKNREYKNEGDVFLTYDDSQTIEVVLTKDNNNSVYSDLKWFLKDDINAAKDIQIESVKDNPNKILLKLDKTILKKYNNRLIIKKANAILFILNIHISNTVIGEIESLSDNIKVHVKYKETWSKVFEVFKNNITLKTELYHPLIKAKVEIYFVAVPQETMDIFVPENSAGNTKGFFIDWLGGAAKELVVFGEIARTGRNKLGDYEREKIRFYNKVFNKLSLKTEDIVYLAKKDDDDIDVYLVMISEDKFDFNLKKGKESLKSITNCAAHEIGLHLINVLNNINISPEQEHYDGFGNFSIYTPEDKYIPKTSKLGIWFEHINQTINKMYLK